MDPKKIEITPAIVPEYEHLKDTHEVLRVTKDEVFYEDMEILVGPYDTEPDEHTGRILLEITKGYGSEGTKHVWLTSADARGLALCLLNNAHKVDHGDD